VGALKNWVRITAKFKARHYTLQLHGTVDRLGTHSSFSKKGYNSRAHSGQRL
jgi:hypothetical protein